MNLYTLWQETIAALAGVRIRRTSRPGEQFEAAEALCQKMRLRGWAHSPLRRFASELAPIESCPGEGIGYAQPSDLP